MRQVYIVTKCVYEQAYHTTPTSSERIVKVLDDYHKAVVYICGRIKEDHEWIDSLNNVSATYTKHEPNPDKIEEGIFVTSFEYNENSCYEEHSYIFRSYDVE